ncbi:tetratricopeptide repeat protein [Schlesneria sp. DSM 10557]|uniref:tetratricopeptide repeat protein n=1 Tax=Schlesneria sp. DSM 10557 TaxID=3044399 RepID=UPI0035A11E89
MIAVWAGLTCCLTSGCGSFRSTQASDPIAEIDRLARKEEPGELMERIIQGEEACGGPEGQAVLRAAYYLKRQEFDRALYYMAKVSPVGPYRSTSLWIAGEALFQTGQLTKAIQILNSLVAEFPDDVEGHRCLAAIYFDISAMQEARTELHEVIRLAPDDYRPHHLLGQIDLDFEKHAFAVEHYKKALELCKIPERQLELRQGLALSLQGDRQFAELLATVSPEEPDPQLQVCRADALWSQGKVEEAQQTLETILEKQPSFPDALLLSARIDLDQSKLDSAEKKLQKLLETDPHHVVARYQLAQVQRQAGKMDAFQESMKLKEETQKLMDQLVELNQQIIDRPGQPDLCLQIADVADQLGKHELAESWRKAAFGLQSSSP